MWVLPVAFQAEGDVGRLSPAICAAGVVHGTGTARAEAAEACGHAAASPGSEHHRGAPRNNRHVGNAEQHGVARHCFEHLFQRQVLRCNRNDARKRDRSAIVSLALARRCGSVPKSF